MGGPRLLRQSTASEVFRIHGVTGPDEYTTVVNDNLYTNVMARFNMRYAARVVDLLAEWDAHRLRQPAAARVGLEPGEVKRWIRAADSMYLPYDEELGIHPQDDSFLEREPWDFEGTPPENYPLLLHYHPLVIYRHQVLKQADVVLAMALRSDQFPLDAEAPQLRLLRPDHDRRLVAVGVRAGDGGGPDRLRRPRRRVLPGGAVRRPRRHPRQRQRRRARRPRPAGCGAPSRSGSPGCSTAGTALRFTPSLPSVWEGVTFRMQRHGARMIVELDADGCTVTAVDGPPIPLDILEDGERRVVQVEPGQSQRIPRVVLPS